MLQSGEPPEWAGLGVIQQEEPPIYGFFDHHDVPRSRQGVFERSISLSRVILSPRVGW